MGRGVQSTKDQSGDDALKTRRERNRQAQQSFRKRQQAAEGARRQRVKHLENTIERLSGIVAGVCDDVLTLPEVLGQPGLLSKLQGSMAEALVLAQSVGQSDDATESMADSLEEHIDQVQPRSPDSVRTRTSKVEGPPYKPSPESLVDTNSTPSQVSANAESPFATLPFGLRLSSPKKPWPAQIFSRENTKPFPLQLVEATLSRACLALGDPGLSPARLNRAFGFALSQHCTREELLRRIQWLLGPGRTEMYSTTGINWKPSPKHSAGILSLGSSVFPSIEGYELASERKDSTYGRAQQDELLTALEVSNQLENLGASFVKSDTIELHLPGHNDAGSHSAMHRIPTILGVTDTQGVRIRLNSLILTGNLSSVAECAGFGPVYPRSQIAEAVEASVVFAWDC